MFGRFGVPPFFNVNPHMSSQLNVDLAYTDTYYVCYCDLPGLTVNQITAEVRGSEDTLATFTIQGEWPPATPLAAPRVLSRSLPVPPGVDCNAISTTLSNGVLRILFPKLPPAPVTTGTAADTGIGRMLAITVGPPRRPGNGNDETKMDNATLPRTPPRGPNVGPPTL